MATKWVPWSSKMETSQWPEPGGAPDGDPDSGGDKDNETENEEEEDEPQAAHGKPDKCNDDYKM